MTPRSLLLPALLLLGACAAPAGDSAQDEGQSAARIVNGTPSTNNQDASVLINIGTDGQFCTGVLITPNLVLTARHCVQSTEETAECGAYTTRFVASTLSISLGVAASATNVAARGKQTFVDGGTTMCSHDVALILLDKDVAGAKIAKVRFGKVKTGEVTVAVGYGDDGSGTATTGRYQRASLTVDAVGPADHTYRTKDNQQIPFTVHAGEIATGESTCFGDSGGPLFDAQGSVIGLTSRGLDEKCNDRPSIFSDTTSHEQMIRAAAKTSGHELSGAAGAADTSSDSAGDTSTNDEGTGTTTSTSKKAKSGGALVPQANAGCSAAPSSAGGSPLWCCLGVAAVALLAARRRRNTGEAATRARP